MSTAFNAEQFANTVVEGANQESYIPIPAADYQAYVDSTGFRPFMRDGEATKVILDVTWIVPDDTLAAELGVEELRVKQSVFLDVTADMAIDFGTNKNVQLGQLRKALDLNDPKKPFSFNDLINKSAMITVIEDPSKDDPADVYNRVTKVHPVQS